MFRDRTRQSYSSTRSRPLEHIYHNPILHSLRKHKHLPSKSLESKEAFVKVVDLKLPVIAVPKLADRFFQNYSKIYQMRKPQARYRSYIPELLITSSNSTNS